MSLSQKNEPISDRQLDEMLLSLREEEDTQEKPPVINTFRLEMERERRRSRIQLEIVTIAAFVSVMSTVIFTSFFFRFMLPELMAKATGEQGKCLSHFNRLSIRLSSHSAVSSLPLGCCSRSGL